MSLFLGIDTSNYTTSVALYDTLTGEARNERELLRVRPGELGLRQSDAVFQHTIALPEIIRRACRKPFDALSGIGVSVSPRRQEGSYMPCFMVGKGMAEGMAATANLPLFSFSHQEGHLAAAAYSANRSDLLSAPMLAFHVSGGTTEAVLAKPGRDGTYEVSLLASSMDLKAGQAVDRVGKMLQIPFPAGVQLEKLALQSKNKYKCKVSIKDGAVSLSGLENQCARMNQQGEAPADIARFCLDSIACALLAMLEYCKEKYPTLPVLFSGGVLSDSIIRDAIAEKCDAVFAQPALSSDNAVGIAYLAARAAGES